MTLSWLESLQAEFGERLASGRLAHALLLSGPAGTGKHELAREWVASLLCLENTSPACGRCRSCQLLGSGAHPDYRFVSFEINENTGNLRTELVVDQVRTLISSLQLTTTISKRKVALIHPADRLNRNAANALLKTLEEPPGDAVLLLVADHPGHLPATIRSRCQQLQVRFPGRKPALDWLLEQGSFDPTEAGTALAAAAGSPLKALDMLHEGNTGQYQKLKQVLDPLKQQSAAELMGDLSEIEAERLWVWLSLYAAETLRQNLDNREQAKQLSALQSLADRNRNLLSTPIRKDFLLQDWLIQWSQLNV